MQPKNVMANYQLAKITLDSGKIASTTNLLTNILTTMNPDEEERQLCQNLIAFAYDKNLLKSISLVKQGKYAYAVDILTELEAYCDRDIYGICNKSFIKTNLNKSRSGIYDDHIKVTNKAISIGRTDIANDFVQNTYDYFQRNRESISDTTSFEHLVRTIVHSYIVQIRELSTAKDNEVRHDLVRKTKELLALVGGEYEAEILRVLAQKIGRAHV